MSKEKIIGFITDLPKSPKDMVERLKKVPLWYKGASLITVASLAACQLGEKFGYVTPPPEGTKTNPTETVPPTEQSLLDIESIPVTQESFGGALLTGEIVDVSPTDIATETLKNKILAEFQESPFNPHSDLLTDPKIYGVEVLGSNLIDQSGNKQPFFFVRPFAKDGKPTTFDIIDPSGVTYPAPFLFYTESDGKQFVPGGTGKEELGGRLLPVASYDAAELRYFGLVNSVSDGNINLNLFMIYDSKTGITTYTDPYSRQTTSWQDEPNKPLNDISFSKLVSLISYRFIPEPTSTPTPEVTEKVFVPEGFAIAEGGLLKNPETGKNVLAMNPEANWKRVKEEIIGGLWQANVDWYKFTGEGSDALSYSKENFIKAAKEGKVLRIGIPVRDNRVMEEKTHYGCVPKPIGMRLKTVQVQLDSIQVQLLDPNAFKEYISESWSGEDQEAFVLRCEDSNSGNGALLFGVNEQGQLTVSVGSYYLGETVVGGTQFEIGRFGNGLDEKYPSYFRKDGLGVNADRALSLYFASMVDWLNFFPSGESYVKSKEGVSKGIKLISMLKTVYSAGVWDMDGWYLNPPVFTFAK